MDLSRHRPLLLVLLLLPWAAPTHAQDAPLQEDPVGDLRIYTDNGPQDAGDGWGALDLVGLRVDEDDATFTFRISFADLSSPAPPGTNAGYTRTYFSIGGVEYLVQFNRPLDNADNRAFASLYQLDRTQESFVAVADLDSETDTAAGVISTTFDRALLQDATGAPPMLGHVLSDLRVESQAHVPATLTNLNAGVAAIQPPARIIDLMPDEGATRYEVRVGLPQEGHARLSSPQAFRASNGEAATFIYQVVAQNAGAEPDLFGLSTEDVPDGWNVVFPTDEVELAAGESRAIPVLLILPFQHSHGSVEQARVRLSSLTDDASHASIHLGVRFLAVPQPAGHHDTLFVHTRTYGAVAASVNPALGGSDGEVSMNTLEDFDGDEGVPVHGSSRASPSGGTQFNWYVHLEPSLEMGLDFDVDGTGSVEVDLQTERPLQGAAVSGRLLLLAPTDEDTIRFPPYGGREATVLANIEATETADAAAGQRVTLAGVVTPTPEADLIPFTPGQNLVLELRVTDELPITLGGAPALVSGSRVRLPLDEYSDPVSDIFDGFDVKILEALGAQERLANPGEGVVFDLRLTNAATGARDLLVSLRGSAVQYANLSVPPTVRLGAGEDLDIQVLVRVPRDARDGTRLDFVVDAADAGDDARRSLVRLAVVVDEDMDHEDEAASFSQTDVGRDSPGVGLLLLAGLLVALVLRRR